MPLSACSRTDTGCDGPARGFHHVSVWDHDPDGDTFIPPPAALLPLELRPPSMRNVVHATRDASSSLVRRGRHAPALDGSEPPEMRRLRVRVAQLEPAFEDTKRTLRLCDRARRTADAENERLKAHVEALERQQQHDAHLISTLKTVLLKSKKENETVLRRESQITAQRGALEKRLVISNNETREAIESSNKLQADFEVLRAQMRDAIKTTCDASTSTTDSKKQFQKDQLEKEKQKYAQGFSVGRKEGYNACQSEQHAKQILNDSATQAASTRTSRAENKLVLCMTKMEQCQVKVKEAEQRSRAVKKQSDEKEKKRTEEVVELKSKLRNAETREMVFRTRLEQLTVQTVKHTVSKEVKKAVTKNVTKRVSPMKKPNAKVKKETKTVYARKSFSEVVKETRDAPTTDSWLPEIQSPPRLLSV